MKFNHSKLLGRMRERGVTQATLAEAIGMNKGTLNAKLSSQSFFTQCEMVSICKVLNIPFKEIPLYFFAI